MTTLDPEKRAVGIILALLKDRKNDAKGFVRLKWALGL
jgi:hypothetical protein